MSDTLSLYYENPVMMLYRPLIRLPGTGTVRKRTCRQQSYYHSTIVPGSNRDSNDFNKR